MRKATNADFLPNHQQTFRNDHIEFARLTSSLNFEPVKNFLSFCTGVFFAISEFTFLSALLKASPPLIENRPPCRLGVNWPCPGRL